MRHVRANGTALGVDGARLGIIGFSAGGHLASTVCTHGSLGGPGSADPIERESSRPDWAILLYPVIDMGGPFAHLGSRQNLLGDDPDPKLVESLSNANAVSLQTPQTFICHGANDTVVPIENSLGYAMALSGHKVPFEMYVPDNGPHGYGLGAEGGPTDWTPLAHRWLQQRKIIG
jgi:acetyl esterase/lipase